MLGRSHDANALPKLVMQFEQFKAGEAVEVPDLPFMMLSALPLSRKDWASIAKNASWQTTRMNLNTFARHGVFEEHGLAALIAARLRDADEIQRARVFPYQLLTAYQNCDAAVPAGGAGCSAGRDGTGDRERAGDRRATSSCVPMFRVPCRAR